jgi:hypothetical protein
VQESEELLVCMKNKIKINNFFIPKSKKNRMTKQTDKPLINPSLTAAVWSEWSEWSNCTKCSNFEFSYRTRECKIPFSSKRIISSLKNECFGNNKEVSKCKNCPDANTTNYFEWSAWSECSAKGCSNLNGTRSRWRKLKCSQTNNHFPCDGSEIVLERSVCQASDNDKCPKVSKSWSEWSEWSNCSTSCGQGFTFRKRTCLTTSACDGLSNEIKFCINQLECQIETTTISTHVDLNVTNSSVVIENQTSYQIEKIEWSDWSQWSKCDGNSVFKTRKCLLNGEIVSNYRCEGSSFVTLPCSLETSTTTTTTTTKEPDQKCKIAYFHN